MRLRIVYDSDCNSCIASFDHHCVWLGQCVGEWNRAPFFLYCLIQQVEFIVVGRELAAIVFLMMHGARDFFPGSLLRTLLLIFWAVIALIVVVFLYFLVFGLSLYHAFLLSSNLTTWEHERWVDITYMHLKPEYRGSPFFAGRWSYSAALFLAHPRFASRLSGVPYPKLSQSGLYLWEFTKPGGPTLFKNKRYNCYRPW